jgi:hypothetical protein
MSAKEVINIQKQAYDNREIIASGVIAGIILYVTVDELETLWSDFTTYWDDKISNWSLF